MDISQLKPAGQLANRYGIKCLAFGPPGGGKTPLTNTAPNPVLLATEPGMLSMKGSNIPAWEAHTPARIRDFFKWLGGSAEVKRFDTVAVDSVSQMAEIFLTEQLNCNKDGRKAYGELSRIVMEYMNQLFFMESKHAYLIAKEAHVEEIAYDFSGPFPKQQTIRRKVPYFPGQDLNIKVPHLFDLILHISKGVVPGVPGDKTPYIKTLGGNELLARDRSGRLAEFEQQNLAMLFQKAQG